MMDVVHVATAKFVGKSLAYWSELLRFSKFNSVLQDATITVIRITTKVNMYNYPGMFFGTLRSHSS
jgi:hypothetical protein